MKTKDTTLLEHALMNRTKECRTFGCPEVTIGWYGRHRVDFMETNTHGDIRCYEIKVTKSDFHSKHGHNFVGNYNYYVMPKSLYEQVKDEIPDDIGVYTGCNLEVVKKPKKRKLLPNENYKLLLFLLRSMSREVKKSYDSEKKEVLAYWKRKAISNEEAYKKEHREVIRMTRAYSRMRKKEKR